MTMRMGGEWNMENAVPAAVTGDRQDADELFRSLGCDYIQGYYYSKPVPVEEFERYMTSCAARSAQ